MITSWAALRMQAAVRAGQRATKYQDSPGTVLDGSLAASMAPHGAQLRVSDGRHGSRPVPESAAAAELCRVQCQGCICRAVTVAASDGPGPGPVLPGRLAGWLQRAFLAHNIQPGRPGADDLFSRRRADGRTGQNRVPGRRIQPQSLMNVMGVESTGVMECTM